MAFRIIEYLRKTYALHAPPVYDNPADMNAREAAIDQLVSDHNRITPAGLALMEAADAAAQRGAMGAASPSPGGWGPQLGVISGVNGNHSYNIQAGWYWAFSGIAAIWFSLILMKDESMSGDVCIKNLPFTVKNTTNLFIPGAIGHYSGISMPSGETQLLIRGIPGTNTAALRYKASAVQSSEIGWLFVLQGTLIYPVE